MKALEKFRADTMLAFQWMQANFTGCAMQIIDSNRWAQYQLLENVEDCLQ